VTITQSFYTELSGESTITDVVSTSIYPGWIPSQATYPAITFGVADDLNIDVLNGVSAASLAIMDVDCWATTVIAAESIASVVKTFLIGFYGSFGDYTVTSCRKTRELHLEETDTGLRRVSLQFEILYG